MYKSSFTRCSQGYTLLPNTILRDKRLRLQDKGLLALMLSLPPDWDFSVAGLTAICVESRSCIQAALRRLEAADWLRRCQPRSCLGCFAPITYHINLHQQWNVAQNPPADNHKQLNKDIGGVRERTRTPLKAAQTGADTGWADDPEVY